MKSQNNRLLSLLKAGNSINPLEAWVNLGIYRLGARIFDLRQMGHDIRSRFISVQNRFGEPCRVKLYYLGRKK